MRRLDRVALALLAALVVGCASGVSVDETPDADFSGYRTWDWSPPHPRDAHADPKLEARLAELIERRLAERGYEKIESGAAPDFHVAYRVTVKRSTVMRSEPQEDEEFHTGSNRGPGTFIIQRPSARVLVDYEDALLTVGVHDPASGALLWRAERREEVRGDFDAHLERALGEIFARWPAERAAPDGN